MQAPNDAVVFLGPTLALDEARAILDAQYLPPAQFGDVYRLIGRGLRHIVVIDGVFHGRASIWQRELIAASNSGVAVYGAASMGALRAAELRPYGMIGVGHVHALFTSGALDSDDEVALLHADATLGYRAMTEALVNLRGTLEAAAAQGLISTAEAGALVSAMKSAPFGRRTLDALWSSTSFTALSEGKRASLRDFFRDHFVDWKSRDAVAVLELVARRVGSTEPAAPSAAPPEWPRPAYLDRLRLLERGFSLRGGLELDGRALVESLLRDARQRELVRWWLAARFFVGEWARRTDLRAPDRAREQLEDPLSAAPSEQRLRANSLTRAEHETLLEQQLLWGWLLGQDPASFGLPVWRDHGAISSALPATPTLGARHPLLEPDELVRALPYVWAWSELVQAQPDPRTCDGLRETWGRDLPSWVLTAMWALTRGPVYFGHGTWSLSTELIGALQLRDMIPQLTTS